MSESPDPEHQFSADHIHAELVSSDVAREEPYRLSMQVIRGALAFALNHVGFGEATDRQAVEALFLQMRSMAPEFAPEQRVVAGAINMTRWG